MRFAHRVHSLAVGRPRAWHSLALLAGLLLSSGGHSETAPIPYDYQLKTVYLFKFTEYIEWPGRPAEALRLCFWEQNPFPEATSAARSAWNGRRKINLFVVSPQDVTNRCDLLYVPEGRDIARDKLAGFAVTGTLMVGEGTGFLESGGMIRFVNVGQAVAFDINLPALRKANLGVSSALLRVARHVEGQ
ncbi:YfiR family protein [Marinobacter salarius]|uniref:YfiR family protein n=1 Tax=Marinobacter salarius TaxID=1420917 RepID=UPI0018F120CD|nr:YfiR family protein [Marinobacter salarius]MBJ7275177.1 YfiR family protein [Marinobacter salarius]